MLSEWSPLPHGCLFLAILVGGDFEAAFHLMLLSMKFIKLNLLNTSSCLSLDLCRRAKESKI